MENYSPKVRKYLGYSQAFRQQFGKGDQLEMLYLELAILAHKGVLTEEKENELLKQIESIVDMRLSGSESKMDPDEKERQYQRNLDLAIKASIQMIPLEMLIRDYELFQVPFNPENYKQDYRWTDNNCGLQALFDLGIIGKEYAENIHRKTVEYLANKPKPVCQGPIPLQSLYDDDNTCVPEFTGICYDTILSLLTAFSTELPLTVKNTVDKKGFIVNEVGRMPRFSSEDTELYRELNSLKEGMATLLGYSYYGYGGGSFEGHAVTVYKEVGSGILYVVDRGYQEQLPDYTGFPNLTLETFDQFYRRNFPIIGAVLYYHKYINKDIKKLESPDRRRRKSSVNRRKSPVNRRRKSPVNRRRKSPRLNY